MASASCIVRESLPFLIHLLSFFLKFLCKAELEPRKKQKLTDGKLLTVLTFQYAAAPVTMCAVLLGPQCNAWTGDGDVLLSTQTTCEQEATKCSCGHFISDVNTNNTTTSTQYKVQHTSFIYKASIFTQNRQKGA